MPPVFFFPFVFCCAAIRGRGYPSIHDLDEQSTLRCFCGIQFGACRRCISGHDLWFLFYSLGRRRACALHGGPRKVVVHCIKLRLRWGILPALGGTGLWTLLGLGERVVFLFEKTCIESVIALCRYKCEHEQYNTFEQLFIEIHV